MSEENIQETALANSADLANTELENQQPDSKNPIEDVGKEVVPPRNDDGKQEQEVKTELGDIEKTGDSIVDSAVTLLIDEAKLTPADVVRALQTAVDRRDATLIDKEFIKERFGKHADMALAVAQRHLENVLNDGTKQLAQVHALVGGKEQWDGVVKAFHENAPDYLYEAAKALEKSGKVMEAATMMRDYAMSTGNITNGSLLKGTASNTYGLSAQEFKEEMSKLRKEAGNKSIESPEFLPRYEELIKLRALGNKIGR